MSSPKKWPQMTEAQFEALTVNSQLSRSEVMVEVVRKILCCNGYLPVVAVEAGIPAGDVYRRVHYLAAKARRMHEAFGPKPPVFVWWALESEDGQLLGSLFPSRKDAEEWAGSTGLKPVKMQRAVP